MNESVIRYEDDNGRVRYQPVDNDGKRYYANFWRFCWSRGNPGLPPKLYRSKNRALRVARGRNAEESRAFREVDD